MRDNRTDNKDKRQAVGQLLRETREEQGISLEQVSQASKFHAQQLEAVERGDYEALPQTLWARGILITYGDHLGLDGKKLARRLFPRRHAPEVTRSLIRRWRGLVAAVAALVVAVLTSVTAILFPYNPVTGGLADILEKAAPGTFLGSEAQRVAIFGYTGGTINGEDNVLVAKVAEESLELLLVPGDTPVRIPGQGRGNVGDVLAMGQPYLTRQTVSGITDAEIRHYVVVSTDGVRKIVGAMGGVTVDVPRPVSDQASPGGPKIELRAGQQKLDSDQAIVYLQGEDLQTDAEIARRQHTFLYAMFRQALGPSNLLTNPETIRVVSENVDTNMSKVQMVQLAGRALNLANAGEKLEMNAFDES